MELDQPHQFPKEERAMVESNTLEVQKPIYFLPFDVQLQNTFCIEIIAKRFPIEVGTLPHVQVGLEEPQVDTQGLQAQIILHVQTVPDNDSPPFAISFKLLGSFTYSKNYQEEEVRLFLEQGSVSILLPFARELLYSICARLQVPPMMLTMVQLAPHPSMYQSSHEENLNNKTYLEESS